MNVLQIVAALDNGGVESLLKSYYNYFGGGVHWDFVIVQNNNNKAGRLENFFEEKGSKIYSVYPPQYNLFRFIKEYRGILKSHHYDAVHCHLDDISLIYLLVAYLSGVKVRIAHCHTYRPRLSLVKSVLLGACKMLIPIFTTDRFSCGRDVALFHWGEKAVRNQNVYILKNAISLTNFSYNICTRNKYREKLGISSDVIVLGNIGRFQIQKNQMFLIEVFSNFKKTYMNSKLLLIGGGELKNDLLTKIEALKLENDIIILSDRSDINCLLSVMDVFILTSFFEGLPIVGIEAHANGLPCVFADTITREVGVLDNSVFVPLSASFQEWSDIVFAYIKKGRNLDAQQKLEERGFEIKSAADKLYSFYLSKTSNK